MKFYVKTGNYHYNELPVEDIITRKKYTCYNRKNLFDEDYYCIRRYNINDNKHNNVYEFSIMPDGYTLYTIICDEKTAHEIIQDNLYDLIRGNLNTAKTSAYSAD